MRSEKVRFDNQAGVALSGELDLPPTPPRAYALFAHCFSCSAKSHAAKRIAQALALRGIATLRFDFTGLGDSDGAFADSHFAANVDDLNSAARFLESRDQAPSILIGHSLGGTAVIAAADAVPSVRAIATLGAPFDPAHVLHHFASQRRQIEEDGQADVTIGGRTFTVRRDFLESVRGQDQASRLADLDRALLVMHAPTDDVVGVDNARQIFDAARHPKSFVALDGMDHLLTDKADAAYVADIIATWANRYIPAQTIPSIDVAGTVQVRSTDGRFLQDVVAGDHRFVADEPEKLGGWNAGPAPYDLLLASLGTCTAMTVKLFAAREKIPLNDVAVGLRHDRVAGQDCEPGEKMERITRTIELTGAMSDDQRERLIAIADRCPVHATLSAGLTIETEAAASAL